MKCYVKRTGNDITHWKYIKKVKKNGKWRYYYKNAINSNNSGIKNIIKDKLGYDEKERFEESSKNLEKRTDEFLKAEKDLFDHNEGYLWGYNDPNQGYVYFDKYGRNYDEAFTKLYDAAEYYANSKEAYYRTPIGKIDHFKKEIESGKNFVEAIMSIYETSKNGKQKPTVSQYYEEIIIGDDAKKWKNSYREDFRKTSNAKSRKKNIKNKKVATIKRRGEALGSSKPQN